MQVPGGGGGDGKLDEMHRNVRSVLENVGHLVAKNTVSIKIDFLSWQKSLASSVDILYDSRFWSSLYTLSKDTK